MRFDFERRAAELHIKDLPGKLYTSLEATIEWAKKLGLVDREMVAYETIKKFALATNVEGKAGLSIRHRSSKKNTLSGQDHLLLELSGWLDGEIAYSIVDLIREETRYNGVLNERTELRLESGDNGLSSAWFLLCPGEGEKEIRVGVDRRGKPFVTETVGSRMPRALLLDGKWANGAVEKMANLGWCPISIEAADFGFYDFLAGRFMRDVIWKNLGYNEVTAWFGKLLRKNARAGI